MPFVIVKKSINKAMIPLQQLINSLEKTEIVRVFKKTLKASGGYFIAGDDVSGTASYTTPVTTTYFVSFEVPDGTRKKFSSRR